MCKKYIDQMTAKEKILVDYLKAGCHVKGHTEHFKHRFAQRHVPFKVSEIEHVVQTGRLIEVNTNNEDLRIVVKSKEVHQNKNLLVVYSLKSHNVITVWANHKNDNHDTLDISVYNSALDVEDLLENELVH